MVNFEKDEIWGSTARRPLARPTSHAVVGDPGAAFGPEAYERAQEMAYERITRIQQESPYTATEVVEHVVHDQRLYIGMWVVAGVAAVSAFLTFSVMMLIVAGIAVCFGLCSTPGRQARPAAQSATRIDTRFEDEFPTRFDDRA